MSDIPECFVQWVVLAHDDGPQFGVGEAGQEVDRWGGEMEGRGGEGRRGRGEGGASAGQPLALATGKAVEPLRWKTSHGHLHLSV